MHGGNQKLRKQAVIRKGVKTVVISASFCIEQIQKSVVFLPLHYITSNQQLFTLKIRLRYLNLSKTPAKIICHLYKKD